MIDLHTHVLPGVDDGVTDEAEALECLRRSAALGVTHMVATPHVITGVYANEPEGIRAGVARLRELAAEAGLAIKLFPGAEYYLEPELLSRLSEGRLVTLNDAGRHVLVELPAQEVPPYADRVLFDLTLEGLTPVLAHPERNAALARRPGRLYRLVRKGVLTQVTAGSLTGVFGGRARHAAETFIRHRWVHFIGSDLHGPDTRLAAMRELRARLVSLVGEKETDRILHENPQAVLAGHVPDLPEPKAWQTRRGLFNRILKRIKG